MNDPNTEYILSLSYGKDSLACLEACRQLGYRIDRVVHAEVWATDTIPADLPPMVEFKAKADAIIKERYGLTVEHICARAREKLTYERQFYTECISKRFGKQCYGFPVRQHPWCVDRLKDRAFDLVRKTYLRENLLPPNETQDSERERESGFTAFPSSEGIGVRATSSNRLCDSVESVLHRGTQETSPYGFPISVKRGNWCTKLKQQVFR